MRQSFRTFPLLLVGLAAAALPAFAQDGDKEKDKPAPAAMPRGDASELLQRMETLYPRVLRRPDTVPQAGEEPEKLEARRKTQEEWDRAVKAFAKAGDDYLRALGDATPDARGLYYRGAGKVMAAELASATESPGYYAAAAEALRSYVAVADEKAAFLAEAEAYLGKALIFLTARDPKNLDDAIPHLRRAVQLFQKDGRHDEAGEVAYLALSSMRREDVRAFAEAIHAQDGDFGASTPTIRKYVASSKIAVGSKLPALPAVKDASGEAISWEPGKPMLLHFFLTGFANGRPTEFRDVSAGVAPLWQQYGEKGLRVVGVCMDYEVPKAQADDMRKKWEEWGRKEPYRDGSLDSCRDWASKNGIRWPWHWDGKWMQNPVSFALGGVGYTDPYAVLVDAGGVVRWMGAWNAAKSEFPGLSDEAAKLLK